MKSRKFPLASIKTRPISALWKTAKYRASARARASSAATRAASRRTCASSTRARKMRTIEQHDDRQRRQRERAAERRYDAPARIFPEPIRVRRRSSSGKSASYAPDTRRIVAARELRAGSFRGKNRTRALERPLDLRDEAVLFGLGGQHQGLDTLCGHPGCAGERAQIVVGRAQYGIRNRGGSPQF